MVFEEFGSLLSSIIIRSPSFKDRLLFWTIIANPKAGGFTIRSRWNRHRDMLHDCVRLAEQNPLRENCGPSRTARLEGQPGGMGLILTNGRGHAGDITDMLIEEAAGTAEMIGAATKKRPFFLVICSGGDGTSLEVMSSLFNAPEEVRQNFAVLRLPMGTANDGADAFELDKALELLINPAVFQRQRVLQLVTASGKGPFLAFNILSVGADAFVTHMTNKMKGKLPGDSYKLWVDIAALFYDKVYKVGIMDINSSDEQGREVKTLSDKFLLLAVGESGKRCYGSRNWVLPDDRNVCAIKQMPLSKKLSLKADLKRGEHIHKEDSILWNANRVEFKAQYPLLAQMDGETVLLENEDFPAYIELSDPTIPILKPSVKAGH